MIFLIIYLCLYSRKIVGLATKCGPELMRLLALCDSRHFGGFRQMQGQFSSHCPLVASGSPAEPQKGAELLIWDWHWF